MDHVFRFTFNGVLIVFEGRKKAEYTRKRKRAVICKQFFPASGVSPPRGKQ